MAFRNLFRLVVILCAIFSVAVSVQAAADKYKFPDKLTLSYEGKSGIGCSPGLNCPETVTNKLETLPEMQAQLDNKNNSRIQEFVKSFGKNAKLYAYRISTPGGGAGAEYEAHPRLAQVLMDQMGCETGDSYRRVTNSADVIFGYSRPSDVAKVAGLTSNFFDSLFEMTRSLGHYDEGTRKFPYYYPQFKPLNRYVAFTCFKHLYTDEDGVWMGKSYGGIFFGDESDFSPAGKLPPVGILGNDGRIGFLLVFGQ